MDYFEVDFDQCKVGSMYVAVVAYETVGQGIAVGKVKTVDSNALKFTGSTYTPTTTPVYKKECVTSAWLFDRGADDEDFESWAVVTYFNALTKNSKKLPKSVQRAIHGREISWGT